MKIFFLYFFTLLFLVNMAQVMDCHVLHRKSCVYILIGRVHDRLTRLAWCDPCWPPSHTQVGPLHCTELWRTCFCGTRSEQSQNISDQQAVRGSHWFLAVDVAMTWAAAAQLPKSKSNYTKPTSSNGNGLLQYGARYGIGPQCQIFNPPFRNLFA